MATYHLRPTVFNYTYGPGAPLATIKSGDTVVAETYDAMGFDAQRRPLPENMKQHVPGTSLRQSNPVVGPIYVEGAEEGDLLAVHIRRIRLNRDFATSKQSANFGSLTGEWAGHTLLYNPPNEVIWYEWKLDLERNVAVLDLPHSALKRVEAPLAPFIGSIGVAPRFGRVETTLTPGEYGGNMDCVETCEGTTLYLPVWARGGYLAFGDIHALQGDGEVSGTALEVSAEVMLQVDVLKNRPADWPRMENPTHIMTAGSTRDLMDCVRLAQMEMLRWLVEDYGFQRAEAWQLNAQVGTMRIGNVVDPLYTVVAKFPKACLPQE
jgi:amidase